MLLMYQLHTYECLYILTSLFSVWRRPEVSVKESFIGDVGDGAEALRSLIAVATDKLIIPELVSK